MYANALGLFVQHFAFLALVHCVMVWELYSGCNAVGVRALNYYHPYLAQFCIVSPRFVFRFLLFLVEMVSMFRIYRQMSAILSKLRSEYPNERSE